VIIEKTTSPQWLSNTWLVADEPGGHAVIIDTGGPTEPIRASIERLRLTVTHVLCTHHHFDHVAHNAQYASDLGCPICGHGAERELFGDLDMELYKSNGSLIASATSSSNNEELDSPPGLRFLKVFGYGGATANYTLVIED